MTPSHRLLTTLGLAAIFFLVCGRISPDPLSVAEAQTGPDVRAEMIAALEGVDLDPLVLRELASGRYWHASRLLEDVEFDDPLFRAETESGWRNWIGVWELLEGIGDESSASTRLWVLRGRAAEALDRGAEAIHSYRRALRNTEELGSGSAMVTRVRLARLLATEGSTMDAVAVLDEVIADHSMGGGWLALEIAEGAAEDGDVAGARAAVDRIAGADVLGEAWDVVGRAHLVAGDTAGAMGAFLDVAREAPDRERRAAAWSRLGRIRLERGEVGAAYGRFRRALSLDGRVDAARGIAETGTNDPELALRAFRILEGTRHDTEALAVLELHRELRSVEDPLPDDLRLARARLLASEDRPGDAEAEARDLAGSSELALAAPALDLLATVRRRQGRIDEARALQDRLVERFPSHPIAVDVVFFRADDRHDREDWNAALDGYRRVVEMAPELDRAGLARMRMGQIHLTHGRHEEAARVFEDYLEAFPDGRRWDEARYWAAWSRAALDEEERARAHVHDILDRDPFSYYAIMGSRLLGQRFAPDVPDGATPPRVPQIEDELQDLVVLREAGLERAVPGRVRALVDRYEASEDTLLRLSLELSERGFAMEGISLAWEIQRRGVEWNRWLVRAIYPFPYRDLVRLEAEEWGLDPLHLAALIRQESAFLAGARSGAGAMGLMQVIPSTGRSLAQSVGPRTFDEDLLLHPEVNLHLGAAYLSRLNERFGERTALVLAAYNAGPTRASRWERSFPEAEDPLRFTERIPYAETRGYVKRVTRNVELYRWLYAGD